MVEERAFWLAWSQIDGIGPILLKRLHQHFGLLSNAWVAHPSELASIDGLGLLTADAIAVQRQQINPVHLLEQHEQQNLHFWTPADANYPRLLLEIPDPPPVLYYRGNVVPDENSGLIPAIAIVGTRNPSDYGRRWTRRLCTTLIQHGFTVVSGLAEGIDTEVHRSCVAFERRNIAVLGTGVDVVYPSSNRRLYEQVLDCGLALSEHPAGTQPDRTHFPRRNRIIAGISRAVIVTEAPAKSGALITAYQANDYGRDVYVLPGSLDNSRALGCLQLLTKGANIILSEAHLLEQLGNLPTFNSGPEPALVQLALNLEPDLERVFHAIEVLSQQHNLEAVPFDLIVQQTELMAGVVSSALLQLELKGLVVEHPGLRYQQQPTNALLQP